MRIYHRVRRSLWDDWLSPSSEDDKTTTEKIVTSHTTTTKGFFYFNPFGSNSEENLDTNQNTITTEKSDKGTTNTEEKSFTTDPKTT